jgi:predicted Zn finger-like uncharacterized protein
MRLVCPNCSAQYEVDASMIPDEGRDVQCSNCGHTWFELPAPQVPAFEEALAAEPVQDGSEATEIDEDEEEDRARTRPTNLSREIFEDDDDRDDDTWGGPDSEENEAERDAKLSDTVRAIATASAEEKAGDDDDGEDEAPAAASVTGKLRRPADAADLDILKEEAERELSQRRAPPPDTLETQADLGLDEVRKRNTPSRALRARMAHLGEETDEPESKDTERPHAPMKPSPRDEEDGDYAAPRRDLLPDIDEINSTLKPTSRRKDTPPVDEARQRSGFRAGFLLVLLATIGAIFVYAQAPAIARALPETEPTLIKYVDAANAFRDWIDGMLAN